jgi:hypothetical protein
MAEFHPVTVDSSAFQPEGRLTLELYIWATGERRRIVTENVKDFRRLPCQDCELAGPGLLFTSVRTFPRSRRAPGSHIVSLESWLTKLGVLVGPPEDWLLLSGDREGRLDH